MADEAKETRNEKTSETPNKNSIQGLEYFIDPLEKSDPDLYSYIMDTVADQMEFYGTASRKNKTLYERWTIASIVVGALIPVVAIFSNAPTPAKILIAALGTGSTAISTVLATFQYKELWLNYRKTREDLLRILRCYFTDVEPFVQMDNRGEKRALLIRRCEDIMGKENNAWVSAMRKTQDSASSGTAKNS